MAKLIIALDAMGGDHGISVTVDAARLAMDEIPGLELVLVGDQQQLQGEVEKHGLSDNPGIRIHHASEVVGMDDLPVVALKKKKDSSMRVAINLVHDKSVQACVSAGNTGALMATSKFVLKTIRGISRPAICIASFADRSADTVDPSISSASADDEGDGFCACASSRWFNASICLVTAANFFSTSRIRSLTIS